MTTASTVFQLYENPGANPGGLLGVWNLPETAEPSAADDSVVWRASLPASGRQANALLSASQAALTQADAALLASNQRLSQLGAAVSGSQPGGQSFGLDSATPWAPPWAALLSAPAAELTASSASAVKLFDSLRLALSPQARVETVVEGRLVGRTTLSWDGDLESAFAPRLSAAQAARHRQVVAQVLATRQAAMRMGVLISASALSLAAGMAATPLAGPFSILFVVQFVRDLIAEAQKFGAAAAVPAGSLT